MNIQNRSAFLDTIAYSELGAQLLQESDNGYNVLVGSTPSHPLLFDSYDDHPRIHNLKLQSTAAGRYQLLERYFDSYKSLLDLPDFSPPSQDAIAIQQIKEKGGLSLVDAGQFDDAVAAVCRIWASLPGAGYNQHENDLDALRTYYTDVANGSLA